MPDGDITITRETAALYNQLRQLHDSLYSDPELGQDFKRMLKKKNPKLSIPELDTVEPVNKELGDLRKEIKELRDERSTEKLESRFGREMSEAATEFGLTTEGIEKLKKLIKETHEKDGYVLSPRAAAAQLIHDTPKTIAPSGFTGNRWDLFSSDDKGEQDDINSLIKDPDGWLDRQIPKILNEERAKTARLPVGV